MTKLFLGQDILSIKAFHTECILGVHDWERKAKRAVLINIDMVIKSARAAKSDDLKETLDYAELIERLDKLVRESRFKLIEALAEHIAEFILANFSSDQVRVEVIKPNILEKVEQISIVIERCR